MTHFHQLWLWFVNYQLNTSSYSGALYVQNSQLTKQEALHCSRVDSMKIVEHQVSNQELRCISVLKYFHQATTLFMQYQDICALPCSVSCNPYLENATKVLETATLFKILGVHLYIYMNTSDTQLFKLTILFSRDVSAVSRLLLSTHYSAHLSSPSSG